MPRIIRIPVRLHGRPIAIALAVPAVVGLGLLSGPPAEAHRPNARPTVTNTQTVTATATQTVTATATQTVTAPPQTVTVTAPPQTVTVTAAPQTVTVTAPPRTVTVTSSPTPTPTASSSTTATGTAPTPAGSQPVITRSGTKLIRAGVEWRAVGFNLPNILGCNTEDTNAATDARLDQFFAGLPAHSLTRIWPYANSQWRTVMPRVVKAAEAHGQYLMVVLADANVSGSQCGSNLGTTYPADGGAVKTHATNVVTAFKGSPAVAIWEILNEGSKAASAKPFYAAVSAEIKRLDPAGVVAYGAGTCYQSVGTAAWNECKDTNDQPGNDLVDFHEYDPGPVVSWWTDENQKIASDTGRPWITGEFGFCCNGAPTGFTSFDNPTAAGLVKAEWTSYLNAGASAVLYWRSALSPTANGPDVMRQDRAAWAAIASYTHQWQGR